MSGSNQSGVEGRVVFLHIGFFKTGSTALQEFFEINRDAMAASGILYPARCKDDFVTPFLPWHPGFGPGNEREPFEELIEAAAGFKYTILSNENFSFLHYNAQKYAIRVIADYLSRIGEVKIILYVRRQDELMQSSYIYNVMWQGMQTTEATAFEGNPEWIADTWAAVFGAENLIVRPYEKQQNAPDIFNDFFRAIGLPFRPEYRLPEEPANVRIPDELVEIKRNINLLFPDRTIQDRFLAVIKDLAKDRSSKQVYQAHGYISPQQRIQVLNDTAIWNANVARKYLGRSDGRLFYDPPPDPEEPWRPYGGLDVSEAITLTTQVFRGFVDGVEAETRTRIASLERTIEAGKQKEAVQAARLAQQQRLIAECEQRLAQQQQLIAECDQRLVQQQRLIAECEQRLSQQTSQLEALYGSYSWKLTAPLRWLTGLFLRD